MFNRLLFSLIFILLVSCSTTKYIEVEKEIPVETIRTEYKTNTKIDSIYIHDSINIYAKGDTIFKDKIKIVYKERFRVDTVLKTDSIETPIYINKTEIKEVNKLTKSLEFFNKSGIAAWSILAALFIGYLIIKKIK